MKKRYLIYIIFVWVILMIPFAGMTFWPTTTTSENTELAKWPEVERGWDMESGLP